jgi:hypothetical protein
MRSRPLKVETPKVYAFKWNKRSKNVQKKPLKSIISETKNKKKPKTIEDLIFLLYRPKKTDSIIISKNQ